MFTSNTSQMNDDDYEQTKSEMMKCVNLFSQIKWLGEEQAYELIEILLFIFIWLPNEIYQCKKL